MSIILSLVEFATGCSLSCENHSITHDHSQVTAQPVERFAFPVHHVACVSSLSVISQPVAAQLGQPLSQQPSVKAVDPNVSCNSKLHLSGRIKL